MENPSILTLALRHFGPDCPTLVCMSGWPNPAAIQLLCLLVDRVLLFATTVTSMAGHPHCRIRPGQDAGAPLEHDSSGLPGRGRPQYTRSVCYPGHHRSAVGPRVGRRGHG
ncbi:DUF2399 domain-containing protein [Streptomyces gelaticus]|uniref:DUF2399 domain-containing protein n=1 Tax=Streptomyces gelaticus TaxID=285446 RepID=UPI0037A93E42